MNARTIKTIALLVLLWLAFAANATAAPVFYVPQWSVTFGQGGIQLPRDLSFRGLVALDASTLAELRRWTDIPPVRNALVSTDERFIFLWNESAFLNAYNFYVYDRASMRQLRHWPDFRTQIGFFPTFDGYNAIPHPTRPNVIIFRGLWWFDTETGQWIETPQTIALPPGIGQAYVFAPKLSSDGRWLTAFHYDSTAPSSLRAILAIDVNNPRNLRIVDSKLPGGVVGLDGNTLIYNRTNDAHGTYTRADIDTGAVRGQFLLPSVATQLITVAGGTVYFSTSPPGAPSAFQNQIYRLLPGRTAPEMFVDQSAASIPRGWLQLHARGPVLLTTSYQSEDCSLLVCSAGEHQLFAFAADGSLTGRSSNVSDQTSVTWYSSSGNALSLQGLPSATGVGVLDTRIVQVLLVLAVFALAAIRGVRVR